MKPDWKDAPEWARFVAQDDDGDWYWYESEPQAGSHSWVEHGNGRILFAAESAADWRDTKGRRP